MGKRKSSPRLLATIGTMLLTLLWSCKFRIYMEESSLNFVKTLNNLLVKENEEGFQVYDSPC